MLTRLTDRELRFGSAEQAPPVLRVARRRSRPSLGPLLRERHDEIIAALCEHGAVLLRGFDIATPQAFESAMANLASLRAMPRYLLTEPGRERLSGTRAVFCTNRKFRTGGGLAFTGFHSENYYSPQVPRFQSFCCFRQPWLGGETALVDMAAVLKSLDDELVARLQSIPFLASAVPLERAARTEGIGKSRMLRICERLGLEVERHGQRRYLVTYKPNVFVNSETGRATFQTNVCAEVPGLNRVLSALMKPQYQALRWALHRHLWRSSRARRGLQRVCSAWERLWQPVANSAIEVSDKAPTDSAPKYPRLAVAFAAHDVRALGAAVWQYTTAFRWQCGDVLLFDNCRMAHAGMPGLGPRELGVQMYNSMLVHPGQCGIYRVPATL